MHTRVTPIDISNNPELMRLTEEVARTKKPRELMRERETVAILMPATAKAESSICNRLGTKPHVDLVAVTRFALLLDLEDVLRP